MENLSYISNVEGREISSRYPVLVKDLIKRREDGITEYNGGPLDLKGKEKSWLSPVEITDKYGTQAFHFIYINTTPMLDDVSKMDLVVLDELQMKLGSPESVLLKKYDSLVKSEKPRLVIRPIQTGINIFPNVITPESFREDLIPLRVGKLADKFGLDVGNYYDFKCRRQNINLDLGFGVTCISEQQEMSQFGNLNITSLLVENDPWRFYQILSGKKLTEIIKEKEITLRIDSGCDSGQIYDDQGCECREQLHMAMEEILKKDGIIIHIPTQDGRGYGMVTKMETEGIKRGQKMIFNKENPQPLDTIESAKLVFGGKNFDIRTYEGVVKILKALNLKQISLITDNKIKFDTLEKAGIQLSKKSSKIESKEGADRHMAAKSSYEDIYFHN